MTNKHLDSRDQCITVVKKSQRTAGLIIRTLRSKKLLVYRKAFISLIRPKLDYATQIWSPSTVRDVNVIENVQRAFTRRAFFKCGLNRMSYPNRLKKLNLPTLESRRIKSDLIMVYKIVNRLVDFPEENIFRRISRASRGHSHKLQSILPVYNETSKNTFANRVVGPWNCLPSRIVQAPTLNSFKRMLLKYNISHLFDSKIRA